MMPADLIESLSETAERASAKAALCDSVMKDYEKLRKQLEQVTRERDAAVMDIDEAAPCFACKHFERNGGDCIGAHVCIDDILQDALGGKYSNYEWQWRGVEKEQ